MNDQNYRSRRVRTGDEIHRGCHEDPAAVFGAFEMAESTRDPLERRRWLTFALVGTGSIVTDADVRGLQTCAGSR